jgi:osmotically inducible lipoprotein OsmB
MAYTGLGSMCRLAGAGLLALALAGCGNNPGDRAVSGGLIGAGGGAALGAVAGFNPAVGALVGGAGGAAVGAATTPGR